jgi:hypothetical protein
MEGFDGLPGSETILQGLEDLEQGRETVPGLLVSIGAPRLRRLGLEVPRSRHELPEHALYDLLARADSDSAHSRYNAWIRLLVSFERAAECVRRPAQRP